MKIRDKKTIINNFLKMATITGTQCATNVLAVEGSAVNTLGFPAGAKNTEFGETVVFITNAFFVLEPSKPCVLL
jgi:hypothetical protein